MKHCIKTRLRQPAWFGRCVCSEMLGCVEIVPVPCVECLTMCGNVHFRAASKICLLWLRNDHELGLAGGHGWFGPTLTKTCEVCVCVDSFRNAFWRRERHGSPLWPYGPVGDCSFGFPSKPAHALNNESQILPGWCWWATRSNCGAPAQPSWDYEYHLKMLGGHETATRSSQRLTCLARPKWKPT